MDVPGEYVSTPLRPRRRFARRLGLAVVCIALLALTIVAMLQTGRPRWRTFTFPADPQSGIAVAVDYPADWQVVHIGSVEPSVTYQDVMHFGIKPAQPVGLERWWREKVLRENLKFSRQENMGIIVSSRQFYPSMEILAKQWRMSSPSETVLRLEQKRQSLGPDLELTETVNMSEIVLKGDIVMIYPSAETGAGKMVIRAHYLAPQAKYGRMDAIYKQLVRRIHLVKKK